MAHKSANEPTWRHRIKIKADGRKPNSFVQGIEEAARRRASLHIKQHAEACSIWKRYGRQANALQLMEDCVLLRTQILEADQYSLFRRRSGVQ